jgi:hypothetical protein
MFHPNLCLAQLYFFFNSQRRGCWSLVGSQVSCSICESVNMCSIVYDMLSVLQEHPYITQLLRHRTGVLLSQILQI